MKLHQSIAVCLGLMVGVAADGCFAQSAANQTEPVAVGTASQDPAVAVPAVTPAPSGSLGKTREQATGELEDFQKSGQAAQMGGLYRGSK